MILNEAPDAVILATGGVPLIPDIPGIDGDRVVTAKALLRGEVECGQRVLIVGGNMVGMETADFLGEHHHDVTVVEMTERIAADVAHQALPMLMDRLAHYRVCLMPETKVMAFTGDGAVVDCAGSEMTLAGFDTIVLAMGCASYNPLQAELEGKVPQLFVIGDAKAARQALDATEEGAKTALAL